MADGYNGEITLSVNMDTKKVTQTANKLSKSLQDLFNTKGANTQTKEFQRWQAQVDKVLNKSSQLTKQLNELENQKVPTDEYVNLQKEIDRAEISLNKLLTRREAYEEAGKKVPDKLANEIIHANEQMERLEKGMEELVATGRDFKLGSDTDEFEALSQKLNETNNQMVLLEGQGNKLTQSTSQNSSMMSSAVSNLGSVISSLKPVLNFLVQRAKTTFSIFVQSIQSVITKAGQAREALGNGITNALQKIKEAAQNGMSKVGDFLKNLVSQHSTGLGQIDFNWGKLIQKVLAYGFGIRSLYFLFRRLRSAITEGIQNMALMHGGANDVNRSMTMLTSAVLQCKNALASMAAPILNVVAPALTYLINLITKVVTTIGMFIAALTGKSTFLKATKVTKNYAASLGGLEKATKKATKAKKEEEKANKGVLQSYDELNNISKDAIEKAEGKTPEETPSGGAGGGGGGGINPDDMFKEVNIPDWVKYWVDKFKEWWEKADFYELGQIIGQKLKEALDSIPWDEIKYNAWKVGHSLATFLNGFVEVEGLAESIGRTLGEIINTGVIAINAFLDYTKWASVGKFIGEGIDSMIKTIDWRSLGHMLAQYLNALFTVIGTAAEAIDWENDAILIAEGVNQFISDVDWGSCGQHLADAFTGALMFIQTAIASINWSGLGTGLGDFLMRFINGVPWDGIGATLAVAFNSLFTFLDSFFDSFDAPGLAAKLAQAVNTFILDAQWTENGEILGECITELFSMIYTFLDEFDWAGLSQGITNFLNGAMEKIDVDKISGTITSAINGLITMLKTFVSQNVLSDGPQGFNFKLLGQKIYTAINTMIHDIDWEGLGSGVGQLFTSVIQTLWDVVVNTDWAELGENIANSLNELVQAIDWDTTGALLSEGINKAFEMLTSFVETFDWSQFKDNVVSGVNTAIDTIDLNQIMQSLTSFCDNVLTTLKDIIGDIHWEELGEKVGTALAESDFLDTVLTDLKELNDTLMESIVAFASAALKSYIEEKADEFRQHMCDILTHFIEGADNFIPNLERACQEKICDPIVRVFDDFFGTSSGSSTVMEEKGHDVVDGLSTGLDPIQEIIDNIIKFKDDFFDVIRQLRQDVVGEFDDMGDDTERSWENMWLKTKRVLNEMLAGIENFVNEAIKGINQFTSALNNLGSIDLPGGESIGFNIPSISRVSLPRLAEGAVIPPNKEFLAVLGDQRQGTNIETPLSTMVDAFYQALERAGLSNMNNRDNQDIVVQIDGYEIARATRKQDRIFRQSTGHSMFGY